MGDESKEDLKAAVREAMREIMAEMRPMPVAGNPSSVTEIIIRVGSGGAMIQRDFGGLGCAGACCPQGVSRPSLGGRSRKLLQAIQEKTAESEDDLIEKLERKNAEERLAQDIEKHAKELDIDIPE